MSKLGSDHFDLDNGSEEVNTQKARKIIASIESSNQTLIHANRCYDANCTSPKCARMKRIFQHSKVCKTKADGNCLICKQLSALCFYHAKHCQDHTTCSISKCSSLKQKLNSKKIDSSSQASAKQGPHHKHAVIERYIQSLKHAVQCRDTNCILEECARTKHIVQHIKVCKDKAKNCHVCKELFVACFYHAKHCSDHTTCFIPICWKLKQRLESKKIDCSNQASAKQVNSQGPHHKHAVIERYIQSLKHAVQCRDVNCILEECARTKRIVQHIKVCKEKAKNCRVCKELFVACFYHAKHCSDHTTCFVPICWKLKQKLESKKIDCSNQASAKQVNSEGPHKDLASTTERFIQLFTHAVQCRDANCMLKKCASMKRVVQHTKVCKTKANANCPVCKQLSALCFYHAEHCPDHTTTCFLPVCSSLKQKPESNKIDSSNQAGAEQVNPQGLCKDPASIESDIQSMIHVVQCRDVNCTSGNCANIKYVVQHTQVCITKANGNCLVCKRLSALCLDHAEHFSGHTACSLTICSSLKLELESNKIDSSNQASAEQVNPQEPRKNPASIERCIQSLTHAVQCRDANCTLRMCARMKRLVPPVCKKNKAKGHFHFRFYKP